MFCSFSGHSPLFQVSIVVRGYLRNGKGAGIEHMRERFEFQVGRAKVKTTLSQHLTFLYHTLCKWLLS